ncbi:MAG: hypothetical protein ACD_39C00546G0001, partial [uncultured bacterium]
RLEQRDPQVIRALSEILIKAGERKILEDLVERFAQLKHENQVEALIPSLSSSLKILEQGDKMPEPLLKSFEKIEVSERPLPSVQPAEPVEEPGEIEEPDLPVPEEVSAKSPPEKGDDAEEPGDLDLADDEEGDSELPGLLSLGDLGDSGSAEDRPARKPVRDKPKVSLHYRAGLKAYNVGKYKKALAEFSSLLETEASPPANVYLYMGLMLCEQESYDQARDYLQNFLGKEPNHSKANFVLGKVYKQLKFWNGLIEVYERFVCGEIEASPKMKTKIYHDLGLACVLVGKYERGAQLLDSLLKLHPEDAEVGYYLALAHFHLNKISSASQILHQASKSAIGNKRISKLIEALAAKVRSGGI